VSVSKRALSAIGKLGIVVAIAIAFFAALLGTIYYSLKSREVNVPNVVGKDVLDGEKALDQDGLNMRRRATRYSANAKPNTILDQSPHAGEIVKVGQTVAVVVSRSSSKEGGEGIPNSPDTSAEEEKKTESSASKNENLNSNKANRNTKNKNSNNSNNANNANANQNRNSNANNRNANNRNANNGKTNSNQGSTNSGRNSNSGTLNMNNGRSNSTSNSNKRNSATTTPTTNQNRNRRVP